MKNTIEYKGYIGSVEFSPEDELFFGQVQGVRALILYEGSNVKELLADFHGAVDDYIELCEANGEEAEKPYKGSFNIRIKPELHRKAAMVALSRQISLNSFVEESIEAAVEREIG